MKIEIIDLIIKVAACVCGKDGVISQAEEKSILDEILYKYPNYSTAQFNKVLDEFFNENYQLEDYLDQITDTKSKRFIIKLCEISASADGLNIKENIALNKVQIIFGMQS